MQPIALAQKFVNILFENRNLHALRPLLADDFSFCGPLYACNSADAYVDAMQRDPLENARFRLQHASQEGETAFLIYQFEKPGISVPMVHIFAVQGGKITRSELIFDARAFH